MVLTPPQLPLESEVTPDHGSVVGHPLVALISGTLELSSLMGKSPSGLLELGLNPS